MTRTSQLGRQPSSKSSRVSRTLARRQLVKTNRRPPHRLSYLESRSVRPSTLRDYTTRFNQIIAWLGSDPSLVDNLRVVDELMVEYLEGLFDIGAGIDSGIRAVASLKFFHPLLGKGTTGALPRASRCLKGWGLAAPPRQRLPVPLEGLGAVIGLLILRGLWEMGLRLFIQFICYLRPGECSGLLRKQLVPPQSRGQPMGAFRQWVILLHPTEDMVPGKTGIFDASVIIDSDSWMETLLHRLRGAKEDNQALWSQSSTRSWSPLSVQPSRPLDWIIWGGTFTI